MTIFCKLCHHAIQSGKPDLDAQSDVLQLMGIHLGNVHRKHAEELAAVLSASSQLSATYLLMKNFVDVPASETALLESFAENEKALMASLGLEPIPGTENFISTKTSGLVN